MARRVLGAGFPLTVWNRTAARADELVAAGARAARIARASSPRPSDVVVTMVADADALGALLHGDDGLLAGLGPDSILVDMSTIGPAAAASLRRRGRRPRGAALGRRAGLRQHRARAAGHAHARWSAATPDAVARVTPVLEAMGAEDHAPRARRVRGGDEGRRQRRARRDQRGDRRGPRARRARGDRARDGVRRLRGRRRRGAVRHLQARGVRPTRRRRRSPSRST